MVMNFAPGIEMTLLMTSLTVRMLVVGARVALGDVLHGRLGIGVSGGAAVGGAASWVMSGDGLLGILVTQQLHPLYTQQLAVRMLLLRTGRLPPSEGVLSPPLEIVVHVERCTNC